MRNPLAPFVLQKKVMALETDSDQVTTELQAAYAAGKASAAFDRARFRGLRAQLVGIERDANRLQGRLDSIARALPDDDGWHH
jgi:hypothetical protein